MGRIRRGIDGRSTGVPATESIHPESQSRRPRPSCQRSMSARSSWRSTAFRPARTTRPAWTARALRRDRGPAPAASRSRGGCPATGSALPSTRSSSRWSAPAGRPVGRAGTPPRRGPAPRTPRVSRRRPPGVPGQRSRSMGYAWQRRVTTAVDMLVGTGLPLGVIARRCGFATTQHFSRRVRQHTGLPPTEVRRRRWDGTAPDGRADRPGCPAVGAGSGDPWPAPAP